MNPDEAIRFLDFVKARHAAYEARQAGRPQPWSSDPVVNSNKFTNVFRVLDYGSQFVFRFLEDDPEPRDLLMRLFLYRHTGRVETWEHLYRDFAGWPTVTDLDDVFESWKQYRGVGVVKVNSKPRIYAERGNKENRHAPGGYQSTEYEKRMFTGAYLVFPQSQERGTDKLWSIVDLTKRLFQNGTVAERFLMPGTQRDKFEVLRSNKGVADFMSMQILTDWGYLSPGPRDLEDGFVVPGPGALKGAKVIAPSWRAERVIEWGWSALRAEADCPSIYLGAEPWTKYRLPSYMDVQNCLCEFSKYVRFSEKPTKGPYVPAHPGPLPDPVLPQHW